MRDLQIIHDKNANAVCATYTRAIREGNTTLQKVLRNAHQDLTQRFDNLDSTVYCAYELETDNLYPRD